MKSLHASGKWDSENDDVATVIAKWIETYRPAFISHTEAARHRDSLFAAGYTTWHPYGIDGQAECAVMVRDDVRASAKPVRLSRLGIPRRMGDQPFALDLDVTEPVKHHRLIVHMPSGVEGLTGLRHNAQAAVYRDAIEGLKAHVALIDGPVVITADWNLNLRRPWVRRYLRSHFPGFTFTPLPARGGTHGPRFIDFSLARGINLTAARVVPNPASDHRALIERARIKEPAGMKLVTRAQWGARPRGATTSTHPIGKTLGITAHWEGPHMGAFAHDQCAGKVRGIEVFHRDTRGWADIAYNALVCPHGFVFEGRGPGVKSAANGDTQTNEDWYAVCYLGGEGDGFTAAGKQAYLDAFGWLAREGAAGPKRNGHRDHKATACPGDEIYKWVSALPDGAGAPAVAPPAPTTPTRVSRARILLEQAFKAAGPRRRAAIKAALDRLPKR